MPGRFGVTTQPVYFVNLTAGANQAISGKKLVAKPWDSRGSRRQTTLSRFAINRVEPKADFGQLGGDRVHVYAEDIPVGDIHPHFLQFGWVLVMRNAAFGLSLL